jgi:hypothetical protein
VLLGDPAAGRAVRARTCAAWLLTVIAPAALVFTPSCKGDDDNSDGGSGLEIAMTVTPPAGGETDLVYFAEIASSGDLLLVDVRARDVSSDFDAYDVEISFDPVVAEAFALTQGSLLEFCSGQQTFKADNVATNANSTGNITFSAQLTGPMPPPCTVMGDQQLARITFRAKGTGSFPLEFIPYNQDPNNPAGTHLSRTMPPVPAVAITPHDGQAMIEVD